MVGSFLLSVLLAQAVAAAHVAPAATAPADGESKVSFLVESSTVRDTVERDGASVRTIERSIHLRDVAAVQLFGQLAHYYIAGVSEVSFDRATIRKGDERRVEVPRNAVEDVNPFGLSGTTPSDMRLRKLLIPGLEPGDRLDFRITIRARPLFTGWMFGDMSFEAHEHFGTDQLYELDLPADKAVAVRLRDGFPGAFESVPGRPGRTVRRLVLKKLRPGEAPERRRDDDPDAAAPDVLYSSFDSWTEVGRWWWDLARERVLPDETVRSTASRLVEGKQTPREKLEALHAFAVEKVRYFSVSFGTGRMQPRKASEVLESRYGDCKDKHALLAALAAAVGIELKPVLVFAGPYLMHDDVPSPVQFNHLISVATLSPDPKDWLWLDSTAMLAPAGYLAREVRGKRALLIDGTQGGRVVETPARLPYATLFRVETKATLEPSGPLKAHVTWTLRADAEPSFRVAGLGLPSLTVEQQREAAKSFASEWSKGKAENLRIPDAADSSKPLLLEYDVEHTMKASTFAKAWDLWLPAVDFGLPEASTEPAREIAAKLDFPDEFVLRGECRLPEGMKARAPLSVTLERPFASYRSVYSVEGGILRAERVLRVHAREIRRPDAAAYEAFRKAVDQDRRQEFPIEAWRAPGAPLDASALHAEGYEALDQGDARRAEELLRKVTEIDPRHAYAWNNLGRALRLQGRKNEALAAFEKQIEVNAFDEYAWANRGDMLLDLGQREEAEKSHLKQIEVAPLRPWAYRSLAMLHISQQRFAEAVELLGRATSAEPSHAHSWLMLGWTSLLAGKLEEGRAAIDRSRTLDKTPYSQMLAASVLATADRAGAGAWAEEAIASHTETLDALTPAKLTVDDVRLTESLVESWRLAGAAALEKGDLARAEELLVAAWRGGMYPEAAVSLAALRRRQKRLAEEKALLAQGAAALTWSGAVQLAGKSLAALVPSEAERARLIEIGKQELLQLRTRTLTGPPAGAIAADVLLLVGADGRVAEVRAVDADRARQVAGLRARIVGLDLGLPWPGTRHPHARRAGLGCSTVSACGLILDFIVQPLPEMASRR